VAVKAGGQSRLNRQKSVASPTGFEPVLPT
jgi:hypothetical protein